MRQKTIKCPQCGKDQVANIYDSLNSEQRELVAALFDNSLFKCECSCGHVFLLNYPLVYNDPDHGLLAHYIGDGDVEQAQKELKESAELLGFSKELACRVVKSVDELKEKAFIAQMGLDDRIMELVKLVYLRQIFAAYPDIKIDSIYFSVQDGKNILLFLGDVNLSLDFSYEIYAKLAEQFTGLDNPLIVDYKWAKEVLGGRQDA